jgi:hypothetical protein
MLVLEECAATSTFWGTFNHTRPLMATDGKGLSGQHGIICTSGQTGAIGPPGPSGSVGASGSPGQQDRLDQKENVEIPEFMELQEHMAHKDP